MVSKHWMTGEVKKRKKDKHNATGVNTLVASSTQNFKAIFSNISAEQIWKWHSSGNHVIRFFLSHSG